MRTDLRTPENPCGNSLRAQSLRVRIGLRTVEAYPIASGGVSGAGPPRAEAPTSA